MALNEWTLNSIPLNGDEDDSGVIASGQGVLLYISQRVIASAASSLLIEIEQEVELLKTGAGLLLSFNQKVYATGAGLLVGVNQVVITRTGVTSFIERNGWYPVINMAGLSFNENKIRDFTIERGEGDASQATISILLETGPQDIASYLGQPITIDIYQPGQPGKRVFSGVVNLPTVSVLTRSLTLSCSDLRTEQLISQGSAIAPYIGYYNSDVFGQPGDTADEITKRLTTTTLSLDFNAYNQLTLADIRPKASPDYTFFNEDIYRENGRDPKLSLATRGSITNAISINYSYQYQTGFQKVYSYTWDGNYGGACNFLTNAYTVAKREMVESAIKAAGLPLLNKITYVPVLKSGFYLCSGVYVGWSTTSTQGSNVVATQDQRQSDGSVTKIPITTTNERGEVEQVYQFVASSFTDLAPTLCFGAAWQAKQRWTQNVTEVYNIAVVAPDSIDAYGFVPASETTSIISEADTSDWEAFGNFKGAYSQVGSSIAFQAKFDTNIQGHYSALNIVLTRAKATLIRNHRQNYFEYQTFLFPDIDLTNTIAIDSDIYALKGKVNTIKHTCNVTTGEAYTDVKLAFSVSGNTGVDSPLNIPARPAYDIPQQFQGINLQTHFGQDPTDHPEWNGFIGNKLTTATQGRGTNTFRTSFPESFTVDTPPVPDQLRDNVTVYGGADYTVFIQDDGLEVNVR